jgi:hypothetical protein
MNYQNKWSKTNAYQNLILDMSLAILNSVKKQKKANLLLIISYLFINKELEIVFANIRV